MDKPILNLETFELPFFNEGKYPQSPRSNLEILLSNKSEDISEEDIEEEEDNDIIKENMESRIPKSAIYLGPLEYDTENGPNSWITRDEYYIYPLQNDEYDWAIFRISWDDNWGRWEWSSDARIKGLFANYKEAARLLLYKLWENWQLDLNDSENNPYVNFLKQFK